MIFVLISIIFIEFLTLFIEVCMISGSSSVEALAHFPSIAGEKFFLFAMMQYTCWYSLIASYGYKWRYGRFLISISSYQLPASAIPHPAVPRRISAPFQSLKEMEKKNLKFNLKEISLRYSMYINTIYNCVKKLNSQFFMENQCVF